MDVPTLFDGLTASGEYPHPKAAGTGTLRLRTEPASPRGPAAALPARHRRTLLAVDGNSLTHRAFHAYGEDAMRGVLALLAGIADKVGFHAVVIGFDDTVGSWRRSRYPAYKAQRPEKPRALSSLLRRVPDVLVELGLTVVTGDGHEADDVLGSAAATASAHGWCSVLATSDRDAYSLVDDATTVLRLRSGLDNALAVTPRVIRSTIGIEPSQYVAYAALRGDPSDNLRGLPGVGPTRARGLLNTFATIEAAVADEIGCMSVIGRELGRALIADWSSADSIVRRNIDLMTIRRDVAIDLDRCARLLPYDTVERACARAGLPSVAGRMAAGFGARPDIAPLAHAPAD